VTDLLTALCMQTGNACSWHHHSCPMLIDACCQRAKHSPECAAWLKGASVASKRLGAAAISQQLDPRAQQRQAALIERLEMRVEELSGELQAAAEHRQQLLKDHAEQLEQCRREMVEVDTATNADLRILLTDPAVDAAIKSSPGMHAMLLDQMTYMRLKDKRGMRWHPALIRLALDLYAKGSVSLVEAINQSGVIRLPSGRQLRRLRQFTRNSTGCDDAAIAQLAAQIAAIPANPAQQSDMRWHGALKHDEMQCRKGLLFDQATGKLVGWSDTDAASEQEFVRQVQAGDEVSDARVSSSMATHLLLFTFTSFADVPFSYPVCYEYTNGITAPQLRRLATEVCIKLAEHGIHVNAVTCDGAAENRSFIKTMTSEEARQRFGNHSIFGNLEQLQVSCPLNPSPAGPQACCQCCCDAAPHAPAVPLHHACYKGHPMTQSTIRSLICTPGHIPPQRQARDASACAPARWPSIQSSQTSPSSCCLMAPTTTRRAATVPRRAPTPASWTPLSATCAR
jgi:hypothetical protein